ncbi:hypothetical protein EIP91_000536 [Steccherinum ochraceum]|uniref:RTA1-domain-containing protein n=1 Tax=Steccherinum ochraceum TaxID=92696 RepID=A0A4V2MXQ6_9APHY|nr:hypothetical protein EIP91_000536 [Steccherinum ochraceum]
MLNLTEVAMYPPGTFGPSGEILKSPSYGYLVSKGTAMAFVVLFSITTLVHLVEAIYFRMWWLLPTVGLAGAGEVLGWSGRLWSSYSPLLQDPYLMQIVATILAPTPYVAALFMIFARVTQHLGEQYSRLSPRLYSRIFLTADVVALVVQGAGGGLAATASTQSGSNLGGNIMLGGIIFQLVALIAFVSVATEYYIRYTLDHPIRPTRGSKRTEMNYRMKLLTGSLAFIIVCIFIRSIYRTAELADGWNGRIITTEWYFNVFDGAMILLAMWTLSILHPGYLMQSSEYDFMSQSVALNEKYSKTSSTLSTPTPSRV